MVGSSSSFTPKKYIRTVQITKLGTAIPQVATTLIILSKVLPLFNAARHPRGIPSSKDTNTETPPTFAETGNFILMMSITVRPLCFRLSPKSP